MDNVCPVCNYNGLYEPAYNLHGYGSDEICPCCGFQFGLDDYPDKEKGILNWRTMWIVNGCKWYSKSRLQPITWNAEEQLKKD